MKLERLHITAFLATAAVVWLVVLVAQGTDVTWEHGRPFSIVVGVLVTLGAALEHWLWRKPIVQSWLVKRPDIRGTWRVELQSSYMRFGTDKPVPLIVCYVGVTQTLSNLQMHLMTPESESWFIADNVRPSPNGIGFQVIGVYTNEPKIHLRAARKSEIHQGAVIIETHGQGRRPRTLTAKYWTDRNTSGSLEFTDHVNRVFTRFEDAKRAFLERDREAGRMMK